MKPVYRRALSARVAGILAVAWFLILACAGAVRAADRVPSSHPNLLTAVKETLFFVADDGIHGRELWAWRPAPENPDGICGLVIDLVPGPKGSEPSGLSNCGGWLYFKAVASSSEAMFYQCNPDTLAVETIKDAQGMPVSAQEAQTPHLVAPDGKTFFCLSYTVENVNPSGDKSNPTTAWLWRGTCGTPTLTPLLALPELCRAGPHEYCLLDEKTLLLSYRDHALAVDSASGNTLKIVLGATNETRWAFLRPKRFAGGALIVGHADETGSELWFTDGTQEGTRLLKDIVPGPASSSITGFCPFGPWMLFAANDGTHRAELWRTDGTPEGTVMVRDINPGASMGDPYNFQPIGDHVYFVANDGIHGIELWRTDGTEEGTALLMDVYKGSRGSDPWDLEEGNGLLYFCATSSTYGEEVFVSDGTAAGTRVLANIVRGIGNSGPDSVTALNGNVFFTCDESRYGEELWMSDGTAEGTRLVLDIYPALPNPSSSPRELTSLGETVCFAASTPGYGKELWVSDGTEAGTRMLRDIAPGDADADPRHLTAAGGKIFFTADDGVHGRELWVTDGGEEGASLVCDLYPGMDGSQPQSLYAASGGVFFTADDGHAGREPWFVDAAGIPIPLGDLTPGPGSSKAAGVFDIEGRVYGYFSETAGAACLWRFDPPASSATALVKRVPCPPPVWEPGTLPAGELVATRDAFSAHDELLAGLLYPCTGETSESSVVWMEGNAYFGLYTDAYGAELWRSDGTLEHTRLVRDCNPGPVSSSPAWLCACQDAVYFIAEDTTNTRVVWQSNGASDGTNVIRPRNERETFRSIAAMELEIMDSVIWVTARSLMANRNYACLMYIGTTGMNSFEDFNPEPTFFLPRQLTSAGDHLFFTADDGRHGEELWVSPPGLLVNTVMVRDINPGAEQRALTPEK
ncbi:MAG: hypothetical protein BWY09_01511 [Candidatus Hydrogenedentes bacterium ADurb.Bin179]|nr:MAG: hypothetical protein BWY09_01511 [Candidatus Hydrogenedentes bacterium ADurb.Bin179]